MARKDKAAAARRAKRTMKRRQAAKQRARHDDGGEPRVTNAKLRRLTIETVTAQADPPKLLGQMGFTRDEDGDTWSNGRYVIIPATGTVQLTWSTMVTLVDQDDQYAPTCSELRHAVFLDAVLESCGDLAQMAFVEYCRRPGTRYFDEMIAHGYSGLDDLIDYYDEQNRGQTGTHSW